MYYCPNCKNDVIETEGVQYVERVEYTCGKCQTAFSVNRQPFEIWFFRLIRNMQENKSIDGMRLIREHTGVNLKVAKDAYNRMVKDYQLLVNSDPNKE